MFYEKMDTWRASKVRRLAKRYIEVDAELEVNISSAAREMILHRQTGMICQNAFDIFDQAFAQVEAIMQNGA